MVGFKCSENLVSALWVMTSSKLVTLETTYKNRRPEYKKKKKK
jgi:hypothetical protein